MKRVPIALFILSLTAAWPCIAADAADTADTVYQRHLEREGIAVDLEIEPLRGEPGAPLREGDPVTFRLRITDTHTGSPMTRLYPAAWMDRLPATSAEHRAAAEPESCKGKIEAFVGGTLLAQPEQDLNVYYVVTLNDDATLSVVDPLFGFGNSKLLTMVFLDSPGYDWALSNDERRLFVSLPDSDKVAVVETASWKVLTYVDTGPRPGRVHLQADGRYLWVAYAEPFPASERSGVTVVDTRNFRTVTHVETGRGDHALASSTDDRFVFVTNPTDGTVSVVDVETLEPVRRVKTGFGPHSIAWSDAAGAAFVAHEGGGIAVLEPDRDGETPVAVLETEPGLGPIRFAPGDRLGFVPHPTTDELHIVDASSRRIVQTGDMADQPDQVGFSDELAYVRHRGSDVILMVPLGEVGREGEPMPVVDFPGGQHPAGRMSKPTPAAGIVQAPGATAVLVSNPGDEAIYFYKEGMAAPMGHFKNYDREPRAVTVVDRSLREVEPGVYETATTLRRAGDYDLAFFLDSPRITHCFDVAVAPSPEVEAERRKLRPFELRYLVEDQEISSGRETAVRFRITEPGDGETPRESLDDVEVLTFLAPGVWQSATWPGPSATESTRSGSPLPRRACTTFSCNRPRWG